MAPKEHCLPRKSVLRTKQDLGAYKLIDCGSRHRACTGSDGVQTLSGKSGHGLPPLTKKGLIPTAKGE